MKSWQSSVILITGGTGTFGRTFARLVAAERKPRTIVIFSRDELKQCELRAGELSDIDIQYVIGDVRDRASVERAMRGVDIVVHAAALKQVPVCEQQPIEAVMTNTIGAQNVVDAALSAGVDRVLFVSTDKAVNPENVYGASKLIAERMVIVANHTAGADTRFSCVRYGNVLGSRGSVIPMFMEQRARGRLTLTDERMTRFWISIEQAARFVLRCLDTMNGGEVFVPKLRSSTVAAVARAVAPGCEFEVIGARDGEKIHEMLISVEEHRRAHEHDDMYVVSTEPGPGLSEGFRYGSDNSGVLLDEPEVAALVRSFTDDLD